VLSGLLGGMLRAQIIPPNEAALLIYWPVGLVMVIFLAMGPVASERADRTWEFLIAQPVSRADVLLTKWAMGLIQLVGILAIATAVGLLAQWSRGSGGRLTVWEPTPTPYQPDVAGMIGRFLGRPVPWLCIMSMTTIVSLSCWYTPLFLLLTRARNEFAAALGGLLLTIVLLAWLADLGALPTPLRYLTMVNPLTLLVGTFTPMGLPRQWLMGLALIHILVWVVLPMGLTGHYGRRAAAR
jgi:hypothetical protein